MTTKEKCQKMVLELEDAKQLLGSYEAAKEAMMKNYKLSHKEFVGIMMMAVM